MEFADRILKHPVFTSRLERLMEQERDRVFCCHGMEHSLTVARLMMIFSLEEQIDIPKDIIYATALLHDIGRSVQYDTNEPHAIAGVPLADKILTDCGVDSKVRKMILNAIEAHSKGNDPAPLSALLYRADKASRACFACKASDRCKWRSDEKNLTLEY